MKPILVLKVQLGGRSCYTRMNNGTLVFNMAWQRYVIYFAVLIGILVPSSNVSRKQFNKAKVKGASQHKSIMAR